MYLVVLGRVYHPVSFFGNFTAENLIRCQKDNEKFLVVSHQHINDGVKKISACTF